MSKRSLIIDTDPGLDDALAIIMALGSKELNLEALTIVAGNVTVDKCTMNARRVLTMAHAANVPVYKGASKPMGESWKTLEDVFGESGLAGAEDIVPLPDTAERKMDAVDFLAEHFSKPQPSTTLCCIGPLTNLALAIKKSPGIVANIDELVIMGGCIFPDPIHGQMGNIPIPNSAEQAEFNFISDQEAAAFVFQQDFKSIVLIDLATTRSALFNGRRYAQMDAVPNDLAKRILKMMTEYGRNVEECYSKIKTSPDETICAIHDAVAIGYIINPKIFDTFRSYLKIELQDKQKKGQSLLQDEKTPEGSARPVTLIRNMNQDLFYDELVSCIRSYNRFSEAA